MTEVDSEPNQPIKIGIITHEDFAVKHAPPYPRPSFISFESPLRIKVILDYFKRIKLWKDKRLLKFEPSLVKEELLYLAHSKYYVQSVKELCNYSTSFLREEVFIVNDSFELARRAAGGVIQAIDCVLKKKVNHSFALVRPPGHHALRQCAGGLCIFNNIALAILNLRKNLNYHKKVAIIDIDDHFGDGIAQYFYDDPSVLYFSVHEFDFSGDLGFINELGVDKGLGKNINFPMPMGIRDSEFLQFFDVLKPILKEFQPDLILVATGFDMYFDDAIGNCFLTSKSYYKFAQRLKSLADQLCEGRLVFVLEGGYSLVGLPLCVHATLKALLNEEYVAYEFELIKFPTAVEINEISKIKATLKKLLKNYWLSFDEK
ncbi:MAG: histone deacetylase [Candidatus Lokiarchaeota archaeon]|nr:histone deacetylase [Candidatus Lokiarchaeota archaeon]MBD3339696.1 histone deacetylase [Candidatus Lokiarchaeota archaeon]